MTPILLQEFLEALRTQKTRAALTIFAVAWGTLAVVLMLAFGEGLKQGLVSGTLGSGNKVVLLYGGETEQPFDGLPRGRMIQLAEDDLELIRETVPLADLVSPSYGRSVAVWNDEVRTTTFMEGVSPDFEELRTMYPTSDGRFINPRDLAEQRRVVFLGDSIAERLFPDGPAVGRTVEIDDLPFTVIGTMQPKMQLGMNNGPDADRAIIPASTFQAIYGATHVSHLLIRPRDVTRTAELERELYEALGRRHRFDPSDERALSLWDLVEDERVTRTIALGIQIFLGIVGGLTLLVAGVGVANIMYVTVRERTREIGIRIAVGARRRHVMAQFVFEALAICLTGGVIGLAASSAIILGVSSLPTEGMVAELLANPALSLPVALTTISVLTTLGLAAGTFPARKAAAIDPVEALRYE